VSSGRALRGVHSGASKEQGRTEPHEGCDDGRHGDRHRHTTSRCFRSFRRGPTASRQVTEITSSVKASVERTNTNIQMADGRGHSVSCRREVHFFSDVLRTTRLATRPSRSPALPPNEQMQHGATWNHCRGRRRSRRDLRRLMRRLRTSSWFIAPDPLRFCGRQARAAAWRCNLFKRRVEHNGMKDHWKVSRQKEPRAKQDQHHHNAEKELLRERWTDPNEQKKSSWSDASRGREKARRSTHGKKKGHSNIVSHVCIRGLGPRRPCYEELS